MDAVLRQNREMRLAIKQLSESCKENRYAIKNADRIANVLYLEIEALQKKFGEPDCEGDVNLTKIKKQSDKVKCKEPVEKGGKNLPETDKTSITNEKIMEILAAIEKKTASKEINGKEHKLKAGLRHRRRPDAVSVHLGEDCSYLQVYSELKVNPAFSDFEITSIRKTKTGNLILEMPKNSGNKEKVASELKKIFGDSAKVIVLEGYVDLEIQDIPELTTKEDVHAALKAKLPSEQQQDIKIKFLREGARRTKIAGITTTKAAAKVLTKEDKIKIGIVTCKIKVLPKIIRCFKCHRLGHFAVSCKHTTGEEQLCRRCGSDQHVMKECKSKPKCIICIENGMSGSDVAHISASTKCPQMNKLRSKSVSL